MFVCGNEIFVHFNDQAGAASGARLVVDAFVLEPFRNCVYFSDEYVKIIASITGVSVMRT